jgi:hypothetical protein
MDELVVKPEPKAYLYVVKIEHHVKDPYIRIGCATDAERAISANLNERARISDEAAYKVIMPSLKEALVLKKALKNGLYPYRYLTTAAINGRTDWYQDCVEVKQYLYDSLKEHNKHRIDIDKVYRKYSTLVDILRKKGIFKK